MKKIILTLAILLFATPAFAKTIQVEVEGIVCAFCAQGIKKQFKKIDDVAKVEVDMDSKVVSIDTKDDSDISDDKIKALITDAGYTVKNIKR